MNFSHVDAIVSAVLYEGYILYPYRPSSVKNRQRWTFGGVYPRDYALVEPSSPSHMQSEVLVSGDADTRLEIRVRFLHLVDRQVGAPAAASSDAEPTFADVQSLSVGPRTFHSWEEVIERDIRLPVQRLVELIEAVSIPFRFAGEQAIEELMGEDGAIAGRITRASATVEGHIDLSAIEISPGTYRLRVRIENLTPLDEADRARAKGQKKAFVSTHTILGVKDGAFVSLLEPPHALAEAAASCDNQGTWPVLAGAVGETTTMLSSPIILYDYPEIAPESPGDLFDGTEIDEILTLRILAMTDAEKEEMVATDERARALLERTEALTAEDMSRLHGAMRSPRLFAKPELAVLNDGKMGLKVGMRVRLRPKPGGDVMDIVLKGEIAVVEAIERDFEDRIHVAVVIESDPGREFGMERMPGHRFFFAPDEIEPIGEEEAAA